MKKKSLFVFFILIFAFVGFNSKATYAQEDSVWVSSVNPVAPETTVTVQVRLKTTVDLSTLVVPLKFRNDNNLEVQCDSIHWSEDWFWANEAAMYAGQGGGQTHIDNTEKTVTIWAQWFVDSLWANDDTLCTIYFSTGMFWNPDSAVIIDTFYQEYPHVVLVLVDTSMLPIKIIPGFVPGFLGPGFIPEVGDVNCDGGVTIADVVYLTIYLFKFGAPPCFELRIGDVNCDGNVDISDAVYLVRYLFRGGPPPGDPDDDGIPDCQLSNQVSLMNA